MSWPKVKLNDVAQINPRCPKEIDGDQLVSFVAMASASEDGKLLSEEIKVLDETKKGFTYFERGDVLLAKITPCFENGKCLRPNQISKTVGFGSTEFHVLRVDEEKLDSSYLFYMVWSKAFRFLGEHSMSGAAGQKRVSADFLKAYEIPLPPLDEQKRIAAILDKADAIRRKRQQAIDLADDFLRSVFLDMFGDPVTNPKGWEVKKVEDIAAKEKYSIKAGPFGSALKKEDYVESGYKIYGQEQVIKDDLEFGDYYIDEEKFESLKSCSINEGDMLISLVGSFGKISVVPNQYQKGIINPRLMKVKFDSELANPWFMKFLLTTKEMLTKIANMSHGGTMGILNVGKVKELTVINPPLNRQMEFLNIQSHVKKTVQKFDETEIDNLFNSLSQKAFSGEL